jgi:flagellar biosynthetic protein FliP
MTTTETGRSTGRKLARFTGHYVEMVAAMIIGMVALGPLWPVAWTIRPDVGALVMATDMSVAMAAAMLLRRHSWPRIAEMCAAMYLPFVVLLAPYWLGALSADGLMIAGHVLMFPLMPAVMVWRRAEYWH